MFKALLALFGLMFSSYSNVVFGLSVAIVVGGLLMIGGFDEKLLPVSFAPGIP